MNENIRKLCKLDKGELLKRLCNLSEEAYNEHEYYTEGDEETINSLLEEMEDVIYTLKNCSYEGEE